MNLIPRTRQMHRTQRTLLGGLAGLMLLAASAVAPAQIVAQSPLSAGGNVPGNLFLVPSVEYPTIMSRANIQATYKTTDTYVGYFDAGKCYKYNVGATDADKYFYPVSLSAAHTCTGANKEWSGNYLNWATTQTIDPFRKALTGGLRSTDTASLTVLEKARYHDANESLFTNSRVPASSNNSTLVSQSAGVTGWNFIVGRVARVGIKFYFNGNNASAMGTYTSAPSTAIEYTNQTLDSSTASNIYWAFVRVKVCDSGVGLENFCVQYPDGDYKPEGLIQKYARRMRFSAFGYLNDSDQLRDGAALRAKQKFVGPEKLDPSTGTWVTNPNTEWNANNGVFVQNPDSADASATNTIVVAGSAPAAPQTLNNSGVINYINKFGQMTTKLDKSFDPVSEMYYAAFRYLRGMSNVQAYSSLTGTAKNRYELADGFPVITNWDEPLQYYCQNNAFLGIGDANTHKDKNLKGIGSAKTNEPTSLPAEVSADTLNVYTWTDKVAKMEFNFNSMPVDSFSGRENSALIAGMAYYAHTQDLRPDVAANPLTKGFQTASTYWVDVREAQVTEPRRSNMYWLAAKFGGFTIPDTDGNGVFTLADFNSNTRTTDLPASWWSSGEDITSNSSNFTNETFARTSNYFLANQADKMYSSLSRAFAKIASEGSGSGSSLAANSTRLDTTTRVFQAQFRNGTWMGQLKSYSVDVNTGALSATPVWTAAAQLNAVDPASRNIWMHVPTGTAHQTFSASNMTTAQKTAFTFAGIAAGTSTQDIVDYFRGVQTKEESQESGTFRTRTAPDGWSPKLGDIVNSTPVFVGKPNANLYNANSGFTGAADYASFVTDHANRTQAVWVGANDGMMHAFNAATGAELYAFVPNTVIMNHLAEFANPDYAHKYFVDGDMAIADVYDTGAGAWKTVLVGTLGRGGPGMFALDITNPASPSFLWEKDGSDISALGKNIGRPIIAQVANGDWRVILGNGLDSGTGASLVMVNVLSGVVTTDPVDNTSTSGMSSVLVRDTNGDGFADTAYAGDLEGQLWKFSSLGGAVTHSLIFTTAANQPITAAPFVARDPKTSITWVFFGTGQYLNTADVTTTYTQTWYGIKDTGTAADISKLVQRTLTDNGTVGEFTARTLSEGTAADLDGQDGWYINLPVSKERMVEPNRLQGGALIGTSRIPDSSDACKPTGRGFIMAINPFTGGRLDETFFDANRDGQFNDDDKDQDGNIVSGIGLDSGVHSPIFTEDVMQVNTDDGQTKNIKTQGSSVEASRLSWREIVN